MKKLLIVFLLCGTVFLTNSALATTTIETPINTYWGVLDIHNWQYGQTFTLQPGEDTYLDSISIWLNENDANDPNPEVQLDLYQWSDLTTSLFTSGPIVADNDGNSHSQSGYDLETVNIGLQLFTGIEYFFSLTGISAESANIGGSTNNPYVYGEVFYKHVTVPDWSPWCNPTDDLAFKMELSAGNPTVPEPGTMILLGSGLLGLAGLRRKFRKR